MTDKDYIRQVEFKVVGEALLPVSQEATEMLHRNAGKVLSFKENTTRDISFHRAYFSLLKFVYSWLPEKFKKAVPERYFYQWLKHLQGKYKVLYEFKDGTKMVNYESISFARMSQARFKEYVSGQLTVIYNDLIYPLFSADEAERIIETIEFEFENYLDRL